MLYFISGPEILFVFFVFLLIFGADKIPSLARTLAKGMTQVKQATNEIKTEIEKSIDSDIKNPAKSISDNIKKEIGDVTKEFEDLEDSVKKKV